MRFSNSRQVAQCVVAYAGLNVFFYVFCAAYPGNSSYPPFLESGAWLLPVVFAPVAFKTILVLIAIKSKEHVDVRVVFGAMAAMVVIAAMNLAYIVFVGSAWV